MPIIHNKCIVSVAGMFNKRFYQHLKIGFYTISVFSVSTLSVNRKQTILFNRKFNTMKYTTLTYIEKLTELEKIADTIKVQIDNEIVSFSELLDENNCIFFITRDCIADTDLQSFKLACFDLLEKLNKHFTDTTFYLTHADIDTINEYFTIADFETIRDF